LGGVLPQKSISVIVVNWNRRDLLRACLDSLTRQQDVRFDVVLVDNGSSDGSVEMARTEFAGSGGLALTLVLNQINKGFCEANNQGIRASSGDYVALLNNDAEAAPDWLFHLRAALDAHPRAGMAASKILVHEDPGRIDKAGHLIYLDGQNRGRGSGEKDRGQFDEEGEALWPDGCAAMYRRAMLDEIGGFDEDFFAYADDAELGLRARLAGWTCRYAPRAVVKHHRGATLGVSSARRLELIERNRVLLAVKLFPWSLLWLNGVFYLARIAAGVWAGVLGKGEVRRYPGWTGKLRVAAALVKGDLEALPLIPKMLGKRRTLRRRLSASELLRLLWTYRITLKEISQQAI
jgi:GT2 family glycosyltransferase